MSTYFPQEQSHPTYMNQLQLVRASNGQAVAGMVLGILAVIIEWGGLLTLGLAVSAIICGAIGLGRSREAGLGHGQAVAGVTPRHHRLRPVPGLGPGLAGTVPAGLAEDR